MSDLSTHQSYTTRPLALTQGHLMPGSADQSDALRILVLLCLLILQVLALPRRCTETQSSWRSQDKIQHLSKPCAQHPPLPLSSQNRGSCDNVRHLCSRNTRAQGEMVQWKSWGFSIPTKQGCPLAPVSTPHPAHSCPPHRG